MTRAGEGSGASVAGRVGSALVALGIGGVLVAPGAAIAAPAPCEQADRYAAETGTELFRVNRLNGGTAGASASAPDSAAGTATDVTLGEAKSALVAQSTVNAAAVTRILDANRTGALTQPLIQQAPPNHPSPAQRTVKEGDAGPFTLGRATMTSLARWDPRMACGRSAGQATRAEAVVNRTAIGNLIRVAGMSGGFGTTALDRGGETVASTGLTMGDLELAAGVVRVRVVRPPALVASVSTSAGGTVDYRPPVLEVSGDGIRPSHLDTPGDRVDIALGDAARRAEADQQSDTARQSDTDQLSDADQLSDGDRVDDTHRRSGTDQVDGTDRQSEAVRPAEIARDEPGGSTAAPRPDLLGGLLGGLPRLGTLRGGTPLPLPAVPGLPRVGDQPESAPVARPGTHVHISIGAVRQATSGHAIAARATAISIVITQGRLGSRTTQGYSGGRGVVLDLDLGVLEAAAVAPESGGGFGGVVAGASAGGGLPVTGPRVDVIALAGFALVAGGMVALALSLRRRRP